MPVYTYKGTNKAGSNVSGEMSATSKSEAQNQLRRQQITPKKMSEKGKEFNMPTFGGSVKSKELAIFTRQFSVMIDAGLPLVQCLEILAGQQENKMFQKVLAATRASVEGGATLSAAMRQHPKVFDALYVNMVEAGETGGILDTILQRLSTYIEKNVKLKRAVQSASIYPIGVMTIAGSVVTLLLWKVVPIFATLFAGLGVDLPLPTKIVIGLSNFIGSIFGLLIVMAFVGAIIGIKVWYGTEQGRFVIDSIVLKLPVIGLLMRKDRRGPVYAHPGHSDRQRRSYFGGVGHHGEDGRERGRRAGVAASEKVAGRRQEPDGAAKGFGSFPGNGDADDQRRRTDRRDGCHVAEDRRLLRRRSGRGGEGPVDGTRAHHDRVPGRGGRRRGHFDVHAVVLADRQVEREVIEAVSGAISGEC